MRQATLLLVLVFGCGPLCIGCSRSDNAELTKAKAEADAARLEAAAAKAELAKANADADALRAGSKVDAPPKKGDAEPTRPETKNRWPEIEQAHEKRLKSLLYPGAKPVETTWSQANGVVKQRILVTEDDVVTVFDWYCKQIAWPKWTLGEWQSIVGRAGDFDFNFCGTMDLWNGAVGRPRRPGKGLVLVLTKPTYTLSVVVTRGQEDKQTFIAVSYTIIEGFLALADPAKEVELRRRIEQLEKAIKEHREPATETEKKLVGNWVIVDADKKTAADKKLQDSTFGLGVWTDLKMNGDGTCAVVKADGIAHDGKYQVTVTQIAIRGPNPNQPEREIDWWEGRITSVTETELVLEYKSGDEWVKIHYTRMK